METTAGHLAELVGGELSGDPTVRITGVAAVDEAEAGDIVPAEDARYFRGAVKSRAACIIAGPDAAAAASGKCVIRVSAPAEAFLRVLEFFCEEESLPAVGLGSGAVVEPDVSLGKDVAIGVNCYVGSRARIGDGSVLFPNVFLGERVEIGRECKLYPGVVIYPRCRIGHRVILHAGVVVGADGFGYLRSGGGLVKYPHTGTVRIGDDVEVGANSTIDRAKTGATVIGSGTKIDNLVHIAHSVRIGANCTIVALSGVAGSVEIGSDVTLAAQSGVKDHVHIGDGSVVAARAGVIGDVAGGSVVSGFPARDHGLEKRIEAARLHLPEILRRLSRIERKLQSGRTSGNGDPENQES